MNIWLQCRQKQETSGALSNTAAYNSQGEQQQLTQLHISSWSKQCHHLRGETESAGQMLHHARQIRPALDRDPEWLDGVSPLVLSACQTVVHASQYHPPLVSGKGHISSTVRLVRIE